MIEVRKYRGHGAPQSHSVYIRTPVSTFEIYRDYDTSGLTAHVVFGVPRRIPWEWIDDKRAEMLGDWDSFTSCDDGTLRDFIERIHAQGAALLFAGVA